MNLVSYPSGLLGIQFVDSLNGFAVGDNGRILATMNGGSTWEARPDLGSVMYGVHFSDANNGLVVGGYGRMLTTTNRGSDWVDHRVSTTNQTFRGVTCLSPLTRIAVGTDGILKTTNGGNSWYNVSPTSGNDVEFANADTGFVVGQGGILRTTNSGNTWTPLGSAGVSVRLGIRVFNSQTALVIGSAVARTTNSGQSWSIQLIPLYNLRGIAFVNDSIGIVVGDYKRVLWTSDRGISWIDRTALPLGCEDVDYSTDLYAASFVDSTTLVLVAKQAYRGVIFRSTNLGVTWSCLRTEKSL